MSRLSCHNAPPTCLGFIILPLPSPPTTPIITVWSESKRLWLIQAELIKLLSSYMNGPTPKETRTLPHLFLSQTGWFNDSSSLWVISKVFLIKSVCLRLGLTTTCVGKEAKLHGAHFTSWINSFPVYLERC